ncbi:MAG: hypothetical protein H7Y11_09435 [Armatimonadetes bacterium]|nr:hypothetical protein [Anaerolineae bacterium]
MQRIIQLAKIGGFVGACNGTSAAIDRKQRRTTQALSLLKQQWFSPQGFYFSAIFLVYFLAQTTPIPTTVTARFSTDTPRPATGQAFIVELVITLPPGTELAETPEFPTEWGDFDVRSVGEARRDIQADGTLLYRQPLTLMLWRPRDYNTPETYIGYRLTGFSEVQRIPVTALAITVPSVLDFNDLTLRPFKPPIELFYLSPLIVMGGVLVLGGIGLWLARRWRDRPVAQRVAVPLSPDVVALRALDAVPDIAAGSDALRAYLQTRYQVGALTTPELADALRETLPPPALDGLLRLLEHADAVKFAGIAADGHKAAWLSAARAWLVETA